MLFTQPEFQYLVAKERGRESERIRERECVREREREGVQTENVKERKRNSSMKRGFYILLIVYSTVYWLVRKNYKRQGVVEGKMTRSSLFSQFGT